MTIYLCPADRRYACSWEGHSEDILDHFQQEHDDLLHFDDTFVIDLQIPSENRLFLLDEEIYLTQTTVSNDKLLIRLRYLGPQNLADKITYNVRMTINEETYYEVTVIPGGLEVKMSKLREKFPEMDFIKCSLNITKDFNGDPIYVNIGDVYNGDVKQERKLSLDTSWMEKKQPREVNLCRSKTISLEGIKRKNIVKRIKTTASLGPIKENDSTTTCSNCGIVLIPPVYLCPCGLNFCFDCQHGLCKLCEEPVTSDRNIELEEKYQKFLFPCKNKGLGCPEKLLYNELRNHESNCSFCKYKCPMYDCNYEAQYKALRKHLKLIHGSTKILESFIVVFQSYPQAFLVNEEKGIFYCCVQYDSDSVKWEAKFCGPKERRFFCELKFKEGKHEPLLLNRTENTYSIVMSFQELKRRKLKAKHAVLTIAC